MPKTRKKVTKRATPKKSRKISQAQRTREEKLVGKKPVLTEFDIDQLTVEEENQILALAARTLGADIFFEDLEDLLSSPDGFGITTLTPMQRAVCRIVDGKPLGELAHYLRPPGFEELDDPDPEKPKHFAAGVPVVLEALGIARPEDYKVTLPPSEIDFLAGVRTIKSMLAAGHAIMSSQRVNMDIVTAGEWARYSVCSLEKDNAKVVLGHLVGALQKPRLAHLRVDPKEHGLLSEVESNVIGSEFVRHPSGKLVEIRVIAGKRGGGSLVSRWSAGVCFDEYPRMLGQSEAVINFEDSRAAVRSRLLPGAQELNIGSPWQPFGPAYDRKMEYFGKPNNNLVVICGKGPDLNPYWWSLERCKDLLASPDGIKIYQTDVLAQFADEEEALFPQALLALVTREEDDVIPPAPRFDYRAAIDPATRGNAWAFTVVRRRGRVKELCLAMEYRGTVTDPLSPRAVLKDIAAHLSRYGLNWADTDQWAADALRDMALEEGIYLHQVDWTQQETVDTYTSLAAAMGDKTVSIPNNSQLLKDFKMVKKKPRPGGGFSIVLPSTPDGRHCDYMPAVTRALKPWLDEERDLPPKPGEEGWDQYVEERMIEADEDAFAKQNTDEEIEPIDLRDPWEEFEEVEEILTLGRIMSREY